MDCEIVRVRCAADIRRAAEAIRDIALEMAGMRVAVCHDIARNVPMTDADGDILADTVFGWRNPADMWWKNDRIALESPLICACRYENEAFWINGDGIHTRQHNPFTEKIDLAEFEMRAMTRAAIVVPVHLPFGQIGAVSFNPLDRDRVDLDGDFQRYGADLELLSRLFVWSYVSVTRGTRRLPVDSRLSKREVECLRWASIGKTDEESSMIMLRSRATVRFHLRNASIKLNAVNRSQTVFKAQQLGYIGA